ncbi:hypothetical protein RB195_013081 [Necator americanus]
MINAERASNEDQNEDGVLLEKEDVAINETDATTQINSSFVIIDEPESNSTEIDGPTTETPKPLTKRARSRKVNPKECRTFSLSEKYRMLEGVGGRNQFYMAETPEEASRGFVASKSPEPRMKALSDTVDRRVDTAFCNEECVMIRRTLEKALKERKRHRPTEERTSFLRVPILPFSDSGSVDLDSLFTSTNRICSLETFVPLGNCSEPGEEVSWAHEQLCSMCRGVYMLSENCFPTFFNSVLCNQQETGCIFDNWTDRAHGMCRPETLSLRVLRNRGDPVCEDWVIEHIELPVACQCLLSKGSWLRSHPSKEQ